MYSRFALLYTPLYPPAQKETPRETVTKGHGVTFDMLLSKSLSRGSVQCTDNEAQGQSARLINANGVILCLNLHERLRDFQYLPKDEKSLVEILM